MLLLFPLLALPRAAAAFAPPPPSQQFGFGRTIGGAISDWPLGAGVELQAWAHNVTTPAGREHGAYLHHFWSAGGKGAVGQYCADHQTIRYYVDGETKPSIEFTPAMAAGSGIGWEGLGYYNEGRNAKEAWGPTMSNDLCGPTPPTCPDADAAPARRCPCPCPCPCPGPGPGLGPCHRAAADRQRQAGAAPGACETNAEPRARGAATGSGTCSIGRSGTTTATTRCGCRAGWRPSYAPSADLDASARSHPERAGSRRFQRHGAAETGAHRSVQGRDSDG